MPIEMIAWYEGLPVERFNDLCVDDIVIYLIYEDVKEPIRIDPNSVKVKLDTLLVSNEGDNKFKIRYQVDNKTYLEDEFIVQGFANKNYVDEGFQVVYIDNKGKRTNCTKEFVHLFNIGVTDTVEILNITWPLFLKRVNELMQYGEYEVLAPKNSGLFRRYCSIWSVFCDDKDNIRAVLQKVFNEEVKDDGNEEQKSRNRSNK